MPSDSPRTEPRQPRHPRRVPLLAAGAVAVVGGGVLAAVVTLGGGSPAAAAPKVDVDHILVGRVGNPPLQEEGQPIKVLLPHGSVVATISGPAVPGEGLPYVQDSTTCTFTVTFSDATTDVPLGASHFAALDQSAAFQALKIDPGTAAPPATLHPGQTATYELRAFLPTGQGIISYAPDGTHIQAKWDFIVEND